MKKAICIIRTSTDRQRIEEQRAEVLQLAHADGYTDDDIEIIGKCGASAIKLDEAYLENLNTLYKRIESGDVAVVYAWAIDRIGRDEVVLMQLKNTLIKHRIQLIIKNPSLTLLNSDGSVNSGVEIAFSLFATMAKQEMEQKKQRFYRGKKQNAEAGKFNGGTLPYGYALDENGFYIPDPEQSESVRLAYELMSTGRYTLSTLTEELRSRGIMYNGRLITYQFVAYIFKNTAYLGYRNKYAFEKKYPRLISDELWEKAQAVLKTNNSTQCKATKNYSFASLLIKCPDCGHHYIMHHGKYVCGSANSPSIRRNMGQDECGNNLMINVGHLDGVLWAMTLRLHHLHIQGLDSTQKAQIKADIELIDRKLKDVEKELAELNERQDRADEIYEMRGNKERYQKSCKQIEDERSVINNNVRKWQEDRRNLVGMLEEKPNEVDRWADDNFIISQLNYEATPKAMYDLVHTYIRSIDIERAQMPGVECHSYIIENGEPVKKDYKLAGRKAVKVRISAYDGSVVEFFYVPNFRHASTKCFTIEGSEAIPFEYEPIIREAGVASTESANRSIRFIKAIEAIEDKANFFCGPLLGVISHYGYDYTGDFEEAENDAMREIYEAFHSLSMMRDMRLTLTTLSASAKYFDVSFDIEKVLRYVRM